MHIAICGISVLYILLGFPRLCILISAVFQLCRFYFAFLVSAFWYLQYFSFVDFTLLSSSLHIVSWSIWPLYTLLFFPHLCILTSAVFQICVLLCLPRFCILTGSVFQFCILLYFPRLFCWHLEYFSSVFLTLVSSSLHIGICSISVLYILLCFPRLCYWQLQSFSCVSL